MTEYRSTISAKTTADARFYEQLAQTIKKLQSPDLLPKTRQEVVLQLARSKTELIAARLSSAIERSERDALMQLEVRYTQVISTIENADKRRH